MRFLPSVTLSFNNIDHGCSALNSCSLARLVGNSGKHRRGRQLFITGQLLFIRQQRLFIRRWANGPPTVALPAGDVAGGPVGYPPAGERETTLGRSSKRALAAGTPRPARLATGIIGGTAVCAVACTAGTAPAPLTGNAAVAALIGGAAPAQVDGTDSAPIEAARPIFAEMTDPPPARPARPVEPTAPVADANPPLTAEPIAAAPVVAARAAVLVPPIMNIRMSMLIGIVAIRAGMVSMLSDDIDDDSCDVVDDDDPDADDARSCSAVPAV